MIGPEDVREGDFVTVTHITYEFFDYCDTATTRKIAIQRATAMHYDAGQPMKVVGVCLPFVLVKHPDQRCCALDMRRHSLARLSEAFGRRAFKAMKPTKKRRSRK